MRILLALIALSIGGDALASHPSTCPTTETVVGDIDCATGWTGTLSPGASDLSSYSCGVFSQNGPEHVYEYECVADGSATFTLTGLACDFDMFVLDDTCAPGTGCAGRSERYGTSSESVTITCTAGEYYYVVVEGYTMQYGGCASGGSYTVQIDATSAVCSEVCDDGIDNDADTLVDCDDPGCGYEAYCQCDEDLDGYDSTSTLCGGDDCDDALDTVYPGATETCDGVDQDCDGVIDDGVTTTYYRDSDGDGYGGRATTKACSKPTGYVTNTLDCDDSDKSSHPGAAESCDGADNDCDGTIDEGVATTYYADADGDGYGGKSSKDACSAPTGYVTDTTDCDDLSASAYPGATETCDSADNDCDGSVDEGVTKTYYRDGDGDGYGDVSSTKSACSAPSGYVTSKTDCNDADAAIKPGASEVCDGVDNNCNTRTDEGLATKTYYADVDLDTYGDAASKKVDCRQPDGFVTDKADCDDLDATVYPGAAEVAYDGVDQDCDTLDLLDVDGDGFDFDAFGGTDCVDDDAAIFPGASEGADGVDDDCDGTVDEGTAAFDDDKDGYTERGGDCDDASPSTHPAATEACDGSDEDCDGVIDEVTSCYDDDGDGYTEDEGDCNDASVAMSPAATEIAENGIDDDCDGATDFGVDDGDGDGYSASHGGDCDDADAATFPGAPELADAVDNDCDDMVDEGTSSSDDDGDGQAEADGDCNDADGSVSSGGVELDNGVDDDCDGVVDEGSERFDDDGDGYDEQAGDCDDADPTVFPGAAEVENGRDDDCDALADEGVEDVDLDGYTVDEGDCDDLDGWRSPGLGELCDGVDNDCDTVVDNGVCEVVFVDTDVVDTDVDAKQCGTVGGWAGGVPALLAILLTRRRRSA
jgi:hypothetical protein